MLCFSRRPGLTSATTVIAMYTLPSILQLSFHSVLPETSIDTAIRQRHMKTILVTQMMETIIAHTCTRWGAQLLRKDSDAFKWRFEISKSYFTVAKRNQIPKPARLSEETYAICNIHMHTQHILAYIMVISMSKRTKNKTIYIHQSCCRQSRISTYYMYIRNWLPLLEEHVLLKSFSKFFSVLDTYSD